MNNNTSFTNLGATLVAVATLAGAPALAAPTTGVSALTTSRIWGVIRDCLGDQNMTLVYGDTWQYMRCIDGSATSSVNPNFSGYTQQQSPINSGNTETPKKSFIVTSSASLSPSDAYEVILNDDVPSEPLPEIRVKTPTKPSEKPSKDCTSKEAIQEKFRQLVIAAIADWRLRASWGDVLLSACGITATVKPITSYPSQDAVRNNPPGDTVGSEVSRNFTEQVSPASTVGSNYTGAIAYTNLYTTVASLEALLKGSTGSSMSEYISAPDASASSTVPEPGSIALVWLALTAAAVSRRRQA
jgi:hypothetical protein